MKNESLHVPLAHPKMKIKGIKKITSQQINLVKHVLKCAFTLFSWQISFYLFYLFYSSGVYGSQPNSRG